MHRGTFRVAGVAVAAAAAATATCGTVGQARAGIPHATHSARTYAPGGVSHFPCRNPYLRQNLGMCAAGVGLSGGVATEEKRVWIRLAIGVQRSVEMSRVYRCLDRGMRLTAYGPTSRAGDITRPIIAIQNCEAISSMQRSVEGSSKSEAAAFMCYETYTMLVGYLGERNVRPDLLDRSITACAAMNAS